jgi:uncharacterized protein YabE (DUF348 family)
MHQPPPFNPDETHQRLRRPRPARPWYIAPLLVLLLAAAMLSVGAGLLVIGRLLYERPTTITLHIGSELREIATHAETVADLLAEQGISVEAGDALAPPLDTPIEHRMQIHFSPARTISLTIDGRTSILRTAALSPRAILDSVNFEPVATDRIRVDGERITLENLENGVIPAREIVIERTATVHIHDDARTRTVQTTRSTVGEVLDEAGIELFLADRVEPDPAAEIEAGMTIEISRAVPLTIVVDGERVETRSGGSQVIDALADAGVTLVGLDYTIPRETMALQPGMAVRVIRVTEELVTEEETIPSETRYLADSALGLDRREVRQAGQEGLIRRAIRVRYENGIEISRELESEAQVAEPQDQIIAYGTNITLQSVDTPAGPIQYWRKLRLYATSYHPEALGGDDVTATGRTLRKGIVAIDPDVIDYGTQVYVPGYGTGVAADTGGPRSTPYWIDLGYSDADFEPWSRWVEVYLLAPAPPPDEITYLLPRRGEGGPIP